MSLSYLSGDLDTINGKKKKRSEGGKKPKGKKRRVAKVAVAPARAAFIVVVSLNLLRMGKKLARVWTKPGGKDRLINWWRKLGGNPDKLKAAIAKGSKQTINGHEMGVVAETTIATATAILIAVAPIIKEFKAGGDEAEAKEFDDGVEKGKKDLEEDPDVEKGDATVPDGEEVGLIKGKKKKGEETKPLSLATNPLTISFFVPLVLASIHFQNPVFIWIASLVSLYCVIGAVIIPFSEFGLAGDRFAKISRRYFDVPASWYNSIINFFSHGKK